MTTIVILLLSVSSVSVTDDTIISNSIISVLVPSVTTLQNMLTTQSRFVATMDAFYFYYKLTNYKQKFYY